MSGSKETSKTIRGMEFRVGDRYVFTRDRSGLGLGPQLGDKGIVIAFDGVFIGIEFDRNIGGHSCNNRAIKSHGWWTTANELEPLCVYIGETGKDMSNPKSFRNGDIIRVNDPRKREPIVFVKFGENYYNLSENKQMKGYRFLPPGEKQVVTNLSGMGSYFLMSEDQLNEELEGPKGVETPSGGSPDPAFPAFEEAAQKRAEELKKDIEEASKMFGTSFVDDGSSKTSYKIKRL